MQVFRLTTNLIRMTTPDRINEGLAQVVKAAIEADGKSQRQISELTGIPLVTLNRRLTGRAAFLTTELAEIARVLDISVVDLFLRVERLTTSAA